MIRINLLPEELRKAERTSLRVFASMLAAVVLVCSGMGWFGYVYFGELGELEEEKRQVEETLTAKRELAAYHDALESEKKDYEARASTIQNIHRSRMTWTGVLDQLIDVVNNDGNTERHLAWFRGITARDSGEGKTGPVLQMPGWVQGDKPTRVANFHEDFEHAGFYADVLDKSAPASTLEMAKDRSPAESLFFDLKWTFRPAKDWVKNTKKGPKPAGK